MPIKVLRPALRDGKGLSSVSRVLFCSRHIDCRVLYRAIRVKKYAWWHMNIDSRTFGFSIVRYSVAVPTLITMVVASILNLGLPASVFGADSSLRLAVKGQEVIRLSEEPQDSRVYDVAFSPRQESLVCVFALNRAVQVWDLSARPRAITTLRPPVPRDMSWPDIVDLSRPVTFSSDGTRLAMGYFGTQIWDLEKRKVLFAVPSNWFTGAFRFSATDDTLVVGSMYRGFLSVFGELPTKLDVLRKSEYEQMVIADPKDFVMDRNPLRQVRANREFYESRNIYCLAVSSDGKRFFEGGGPVFSGMDHKLSEASSVTVWDIATARRILDVGDKDVRILRFCLSPNGRILYTCGDQVLGWNASKSAPPIRKFDSSSRRMISIAISPDARILAAGDLEGRVVLWHIESATRLATLTHDNGPVYGLAFSAASRKLVAAGERGVATIWEIQLDP